ncbi:MAG: transcription antitermination factor NusB [Duodenibacillus sp.]|nr:transcription antitermination factor NusB [Duodenibacillus sp.]
MKRPQLGGKRRKSREFALLGVYQGLIDPEADFARIDAGITTVFVEGDEPQAGIDLTAEDFENCDKDFYRELLAGVLAERGELTEAWSQHCNILPSRLSMIERACLLIGTWELKHSLELSRRVIINEAVELSKTFGADKGYKLVNGVLDKVAADVRPEGAE